MAQTSSGSRKGLGIHHLYYIGRGEKFQHVCRRRFATLGILPDDRRSREWSYPEVRRFQPRRICLSGLRLSDFLLETHKIHKRVRPPGSKPAAFSLVFAELSFDPRMHTNSHEFLHSISV